MVESQQEFLKTHGCWLVHFIINQAIALVGWVFWLLANYRCTFMLAIFTLYEMINAWDTVSAFIHRFSVWITYWKVIMDFLYTPTPKRCWWWINFSGEHGHLCHSILGMLAAFRALAGQWQLMCDIHSGFYTGITQSNILSAASYMASHTLRA